MGNSYNVQSENSDAKVKVNAGTNRETGEPQTDFIISQPGQPGHQHVVTDFNGNVVYNEVRDNH